MIRRLKRAFVRRVLATETAQELHQERTLDERYHASRLLLSLQRRQRSIDADVRSAEIVLQRLMQGLDAGCTARLPNGAGCPRIPMPDRDVCARCAGRRT